MKAEIYPVCQQCGQVPRLGLYDGFRVHGRFFCTECEQKLIQVEDGSLFYMNMVQNIKEALFNKQLMARRRNKMNPLVGILRGL